LSIFAIYYGDPEHKSIVYENPLDLHVCPSIDDDLISVDLVRAGSLSLTPPESIFTGAETPRSVISGKLTDSWLLGVLGFSLLWKTDAFPSGGHFEDSVTQRIKRGAFAYKSTYPSTRQAYECIKGLLAVHDRSTVDSVLSSEWMLVGGVEKIYAYNRCNIERMHFMGVYEYEFVWNIGMITNQICGCINCELQ